MDYIKDDQDRERGKKRKFDGANIVFYLDESPDKRKSAEAGHIVPRNVECLKVQFPGYDTTVVEVTDQIRQEYSREYNAWKQNEEPPVSGTPLTQWAVLNKSACEQFKKYGFKTIEQLADATDEAKRQMGPLSSFCKDAKTWMESIVIRRLLLDQRSIFMNMKVTRAWKCSGRDM